MSKNREVIAEDDSEWIAALYGHNIEDELEPIETVVPILTTSELRSLGKTVEIKIEGRTVIVPSQSYVDALEKTLEEQARLVRRLISETKQMRFLVNRHAHDIADLRRELDTKVSLRSMP